MGDNMEPVEALRSMQRYHQNNRGWPDIAYHVLIDRDGNGWEGRDLAFAGDSATDYDLIGHLQVALIGNFEERSVPTAQIDGASHLVELLIDTYDLKRAVGAHGDYADTLCPGRYLLPYVREWAS